MATLKTIYKVYEDNKGNRWKVEKVRIATYRGHMSYWLCECFDNGKSFREDKLPNVLAKLKYKR